MSQKARVFSFSRFIKKRQHSLSLTVMNPVKQGLVCLKYSLGPILTGQQNLVFQGWCLNRLQFFDSQTQFVFLSQGRKEGRKIPISESPLIEKKKRSRAITNHKFSPLTKVLSWIRGMETDKALSILLFMAIKERETEREREKKRERGKRISFLSWKFPLRWKRELSKWGWGNVEESLGIKRIRKSFESFLSFFGKKKV